MAWPYLTTTAAVAAVTLPPVALHGGASRLSARLVGPPLVVELHRLDRRSREAVDLGELALVLQAWR